jgi:alpha-1,2-mannosyltransferase
VTEIKGNIILLSIYLWIGIFNLQPHKEERFMYVVYPLICYNAAHALEYWAQILESLSVKGLRLYRSRAGVKLCWGTFLFVYALLSFGRILAQVRAFGGSLQIYGNLNSPSTICLGKEWYRFPSSFFIPENSYPVFVKSAFNGLLPGKFPESEKLGWRSGTWQVPSGMNDQNLAEPSHLVKPLCCPLIFTGSD